MSMFNWYPAEDESVVSGYLWMYFAITVPLTCIILGVWRGWLQAKQKKRQIDIEAAEKRLDAKAERKLS